MARPVQDMAGKHFGRLKVVRYAEKRNGKHYWECVCTCGVTKVVIAQSLQQGKVQSCGCYQREIASKPKKMKKGMVFGRLTAITQSPRREHWLLRCSCGQEVEVRTNQLFSGHTNSCGCYQRDRVAAINTTHGQSKTREYIAMKSRERLEKKKELDVSWTIEMDQALRIQQPLCVVCGSNEKLSIDHVRPLSRGFGLRPGNAVVLCGSCNSKKFNKPLHRLHTHVASKITKAAADFADAWASKTIAN